MEVKLHKNFKRKFKKLPIKLQKKFFEMVDLFLINQFHPILNNHSVEPTYPGWRSINITGDYRALFEPQENNSITVFMKIGTHSQLYK